jgi:uncharacterized membrane protein YdjX (TVP38/TMEM64 family)
MPDRWKKLKLALNIVLILLFAAAVVYVTAKYGPYITKLASKPEELKGVLNSYGWKGIIIFILLQVLQVVIVAIPGEFVQMAGGYIYGAWLGTLYSLAGIVLGSVLIFLVSRFLGYSLVKTFVSPKSLDKFSFMMNNSKSEIAMFVLFLIPGMPKDILTYIAGLTPIKPLRFFIIITAGRFPALFASSYIGYSAQKGNYLIAVVLSAAALALFVTGVFFKDRIIGRLQRKTE